MWSTNCAVEILELFAEHSPGDFELRVINPGYIEQEGRAFVRARRRAGRTCACGASYEFSQFGRCAKHCPACTKARKAAASALLDKSRKGRHSRKAKSTRAAFKRASGRPLCTCGKPQTTQCCPARSQAYFREVQYPKHRDKILAANRARYAAKKNEQPRG